jgi:hypothetical protein
VICTNFKFTYIKGTEAGKLDQINYKVQPAYPAYESSFYNNGPMLLTLMSVWAVLLIIVLLQFLTKVKFPDFLADRIPLFRIFYLGRGLDKWKGVGVGEDLKFWHRMEDGSRTRHNYVKSRWLKLKTINR